MPKFIPIYTGTLRSHSVTLPQCISECSGIRIFGRRIKSLAFSTDVAIIKNINADAIIAVYPFTPQPVISQAIINVSDVPVFVGVGGGITTGARSVRLAIQAEHQGAYGVVLNAPTANETIHQIKEEVDIPVVITVVSEHTDIRARIDAGADFLNVSGAARTPEIVAHIRRQFPEVPIIATGGPSDESILETIRAGANAMSFEDEPAVPAFNGYGFGPRQPYRPGPYWNPCRRGCRNMRGLSTDTLLRLLLLRQLGYLPF